MKSSTKTTMTEPSNSWRAAEASAHWRLALGDLPDVNVWVGLCCAAHPSHAAAMRYWESTCEAGTTLWFCRTTMLGLVRILSQPRAMGPNVLSLTQAMVMYRQWLDTPAVGLLVDPPGVDDAIEQILGRRAEPQPIRLWTDIGLAATAQSAGLRMVTFDRDFERFGLERCLVLPQD
jgi:toxin-antitoxin system PIN domain toxin